MKYRITVLARETIYSKQTLEVEADLAEEAERIAEDERDDWRNSRNGVRVRIVEEEEITDGDLESLKYRTAPSVSTNKHGMSPMRSTRSC